MSTRLSFLATPILAQKSLMACQHDAAHLLAALCLAQDLDQVDEKLSRRRRMEGVADPDQQRVVLIVGRDIGHGAGRMVDLRGFCLCKGRAACYFAGAGERVPAGAAAEAEVRAGATAAPMGAGADAGTAVTAAAAAAASCAFCWMRN